MRLHLSVELRLEPKEALVSDWIQKLREQRDDEEQKQAERDKAQQRKHELLQSKLPEFFASTAARVEQDLNTLRESFPKEAQYDLRFEREVSSFAISRSYPDPVRLSIILDPTRTLLRGQVHQKRMNWERTVLEQVQPVVELDGQDRLSVEFNGRHYHPEQWAEALIKYVLNRK